MEGAVMRWARQRRRLQSSGVNVLGKCERCAHRSDCDDVDEHIEDCGDFRLDKTSRRVVHCWRSPKGDIIQEHKSGKFTVRSKDFYGKIEVYGEFVSFEQAKIFLKVYENVEPSTLKPDF